MIRFVIALLVLPLAVNAQSLRDRVDNGHILNLEEWRDLTQGKTVIYQNFGSEVGREYYPPSGDSVFYRRASGECLEGRVSYQPPSFCFDWEGQQTMCFDHVQLEDDIYIISRTTSGITFVAGIIDDPFHCQPDMLSSLTLPQFEWNKS